MTDLDDSAERSDQAVRRPVDEAPSAHDMTVQLREALGLFAGAMPISPRQAWDEAVAEVRALGSKGFRVGWNARGKLETAKSMAPPPVHDAFVAVGCERFSDGAIQTEESLMAAEDAWAAGGQLR